MQAPNLFVILSIYIAFVGCSNSTPSLENGMLEESSKPAPSHKPSRGAILEAFLNYLFTIYPSSDTRSSLGWDYRAGDSQDYSQGTPKRLYYAPRAGKRSPPPAYDDDESTQGVANLAIGGTRWKRNAIDDHQEEGDDFRTKREVPKPDFNNDEDTASNIWSWSRAAVRRSPFSPRLGKRSDEDTPEDLQYDEEFAGEDSLNDDEDDDGEEFTDELVTSDYSEVDIPAPSLMIGSALVPGLGKRSMATFSPRLGKLRAFIPRLGKKADFAFSPRLGKRDFAFSPRLGKKATNFPFSPRPGKRENFAFSPRLGKKADFAFSPRLGKRGDFAFSPRLGKRTDFAFSPRLGKRADFAFIPRLGKRGRTAFIPRLGKRDFSTPSSTPIETWTSDDTGDFTRSLEQH